MKNCRMYGPPPYYVAVVHGGPGGPGQVAPIARTLSNKCGVLEPLQTKESLDEQIEELHSILKQHNDSQIILIGHSWGAMLSILCASRFPDRVKKLILISCGPLKANYSSDDVMGRRLERMSADDKLELNRIVKALEDAENTEKNQLFAQLCKLAVRTDSYDLECVDNDLVEVQYNIFKKVWDEVERYRSNGGFEQALKKIACPIVVFHGEFDSHPAEGVIDLLASASKNIKYFRLEQCGHYPWLEKHAKGRFYTLLRNEVLINY